MKRRKIRRNMSEKRLLKLKRQLRKRAKKLRLGKKRTGAYVYGTLRRVRGNPAKLSNAEKILILALAKKEGYKNYKIRRKSPEKFDIEIEGQYGDRNYAFRADLKLASISAFTNWTSPAIARISDYPSMAMEGDWSGIRDSSDEKIDAIFYLHVLPKFQDRMLRGNQMRSSFDKPVFGPGNVETRIVRTDTLTGIKEAERLVRDGWYQGRVGLFTTTYYRKRRATPQVAPSWKTGIYTGRGIVKNPDEYARQIPRESRPMRGRGFSSKFDTSAGSTHADLANFIAGGRDKWARTIGANTVVRRYNDGSIGVILYQTRILHYHPNGSVDVNFGGYMTATTFSRINSLIPYGWRVRKKGGKLALENSWGQRAVVRQPRAGEEYSIKLTEDKAYLIE